MLGLFLFSIGQGTVKNFEDGTAKILTADTH